ncbi:histidine phosphatase family protein [Streptomyces sp. AJS327]|uniref:SixA phosphatase family protein n=1 Tax=Streptomyces sp. AJS327 TaxID=2545265 RepID=UPI0015DE2061|nr:histidine phosphatase family protein [Streptomyces sp. AJS327]MBA0050516.1 histidine phosphatase family protein [Streptomyces sp. AJS327]
MSVDVSRTLVFLRHAKADWPQVPDHERPLAERGRKDAPVAGEWLAAQGIDPQLALCSTAARTRETWKLAAPKLPRRPRTVYEERLYDAPAGQVIEVLNDLPDEVREVLVIGHNPGMQNVSEVLSGSADEEAGARMALGFPTSAVAVVSYTGAWKSLGPGAGALTTFWTPHA